MLLKLIELEYPLDEVVFYDTGMEFEAIYKIRDIIKSMLKEKGIKYVELKPSKTFEYMMFEKEVKKRNGTIQKGYSWCGGLCRWGTSEKTRAIEKHASGNYEYIGIAYDEPKRIEKERKGNKLFPLVEWQMTEKDCLEYCYAKGFQWEEKGIKLYEILDRVSCWCCANKNLKELKNYYLYLPNYWERLKEYQNRTNRPFKKNYSIEELENKFKEELRDEKSV